ncbi:MAG TPA: ThiF family adenylyltransferase [Polyangiaceae bacterium]|nr:ThiF family adenylyltransferase [Polyangiaceae bacterium]
MKRRQLPEALRASRLLLDDVEGVLLTEDFKWDEYEKCWTLRFRITIAEPSEVVPAVTDWFALVDEMYPRGRMEIFPSNDGGLNETFPHQLLNIPDSSRRWRTGKICVDTPGFALARWTRTAEPMSTGRLKWHVERARGWVVAASEGNLREKGDQFELPDIPTLGMPRIAFEESPEYLSSWTGPQRHGHVEFRHVPGGTIAATRWLCSSTVVRETRWGPRILKAPSAARGYWILLASMPIVPPFRWPLSWGELSVSCGPDFLPTVRSLVARARPRTSVLLLGFPIPGKVGEEPKEIHWSAVQLGPFRAFKKGRTEDSLWERDRNEMFSDSACIRWLPTENWHPDRLGARGRLVHKLRILRVCLLGAGALGSSVAELLVRGGVFDVTLVDSDRLIAPNLVRHTLTIEANRASKAQALTERLNAVSPFANVRAVASMLPLDQAAAREVLAPFDLIVDCTANDDVIRVLGRIDFDDEKLFASAAVGRSSRRLYFFEAQSTCFPAATFWRDTEPWFIDERAEVPDATQFEGPGCWHPVFPAQATDLAMMAAVTVKRLERLAERLSDSKGELQVFEQAEDGDGFMRIQRVRGGKAS